MPSSPAEPTRSHDITVYGATGFTGRQAARYLAEHAPAGLRYAIAGRSAEKLRALTAELEAIRKPDGVVVADADDADAVHAMCGDTRVVLNTAGPFSRYGDNVVDGCVMRGADYVDITGETPWVRRLIDRHHRPAAAEGVRIIPFCGVDSVPSDIGALALVEHLRASRGTGTARVEAIFAARGGFNGGTLASAIAMGEQGLLDEVADPTLLDPAEARGEGEPDPKAPRRHAGFGRWVAPFVMGPINTRVVRRSHALARLAGQGYGERFGYQEYMDCGEGPGGVAMAAAVAGVQAVFTPVFATRAGRALAERLGPKPGEGPSEATMDGGFLRVRYRAEGEDGHRVAATLRCEGDPGNRVTVTMLCEAALALALDAEALPAAAGVLTPASGIGLRLLDRLRAAGMSFEVEDPAP
ncbi:MAG: saccharopine dehydrogenase NADP-binding domain-containing protein [Myxococcales bacterium]|nr:saccharopine dehydrogenase NADP-binding domain-containing protein [Myxococcales bacterium]